MAPSATHPPHHYGWVRDLPDQRDQTYAAPAAVHASLPTHVDMRPQCPAVYDQEQLGSCTANAIAGGIEFDLMKQKTTPVIMPSRLFIYYNERAVEGTVASDAGAQIRDGIKVVAQYGVPPESLWPYSDANPGPFQTKPPASAYQAATKDLVTSYKRITRSLAQYKACLASGYPFVFGITVYESFESAAVAQSGVVPMPATSEKTLGGHAVLAVGYDDASQRLVVRNSWGPGWGMQGYFTLPYAYVLDEHLSSDFWTMRSVL
jgi:C1A family cysteine protease